MKKYSIILALSLFTITCSEQQTSNEKVGEDVDPYGNVGVDNVNGNIPDTINTIDLSTNKVDSAKVLTDSSSN